MTFWVLSVMAGVWKVSTNDAGDRKGGSQRCKPVMTLRCEQSGFRDRAVTVKFIFKVFSCTYTTPFSEDWISIPLSLNALDSLLA